MEAAGAVEGQTGGVEGRPVVLVAQRLFLLSLAEPLPHALTVQQLLPVPEHREVAQEVRLGSCRRDHLPGVAARGCRLDCRAFTRSIGERELGELPQLALSAK